MLGAPCECNRTSVMNAGSYEAHFTAMNQGAYVEQMDDACSTLQSCAVLHRINF